MKYAPIKAKFKHVDDFTPDYWWRKHKSMLQVWPNHKKLDNGKYFPLVEFIRFLFLKENGSYRT